MHRLVDAGEEMFRNLRRFHVLAEVLWDTLVQGETRCHAEAVVTDCVSVPVCAGCLRSRGLCKRRCPTGRDERCRERGGEGKIQACITKQPSQLQTFWSRRLCTLSNNAINAHEAQQDSCTCKITRQKQHYVKLHDAQALEPQWSVWLVPPGVYLSR